MYSIYKKDITREFNKNTWCGRELRGNHYYCWGYEGEEIY